MNQLVQHETGKGQKMQPGEPGRQALMIAGEPAKAGCPGKAALDDPAAGQEDEAVFGFWELDDFQLDAVRLSGCGGLVAGVPLVDVGQAHALPSDCLHLRGQAST
jgi:hypothetical protein